MPEDEPPFVPRPRWHVRARRVRRAVREDRAWVLMTVLAVSVALFCFSQVLMALRAAEPADVEKGVAATGAFAPAGSAIIWLILGVGAAGLIPAAMGFSPPASPLKPGAVRAELARAVGHVRAWWRRHGRRA